MTRTRLMIIVMRACTLLWTALLGGGLFLYGVPALACVPAIAASMGLERYWRRRR